MIGAHPWRLIKDPGTIRRIPDRFLGVKGRKAFYFIPFGVWHCILGKLSNQKSKETWELVQSGDDPPPLAGLGLF